MMVPPPGRVGMRVRVVVVCSWRVRVRVDVAVVVEAGLGGRRRVQHEGSAAGPHLSGAQPDGVEGARGVVQGQVEPKRGGEAREVRARQRGGGACREA